MPPLQAIRRIDYCALFWRGHHSGAAADKEWIILANQELLDGITTDDKEDASVEGDQDLLSLFCMGLYELISTEWVGISISLRYQRLMRARSATDR